MFDASLKKKKKKKKTPFDLDAASEAVAEDDQPEVVEEKVGEDDVDVDLASFGGKKKKTKKKVALDDDDVEGDKENVDGRSIQELSF